MAKQYVVFQYEDQNGFHYEKIDRLPDGKPIHPTPLLFGKKINPNCTPGAITEQEFSEDGKSAYVSKAKWAPVVGWWKNKADILEWQEKARVYRALKEVEKKGRDIKLEKAIEPIREIYERVHPTRRSIFIAQLVYILTK